MAFIVEKDEATAGRRFVPFRLFKSDGTSPETGASNGTMLGSLNGAAQLSLGSISAVSTTAGMYGMQLTQSNVSTLGSLALYTDTLATNFPQHVATVQVVNYNPMSLQSGVLLGPGSFSSTTVSAGNFAPGVYSGVSFSVRDSGIAPSSVQAGSYSGVSVEVKAGGIQPASVGAGNYSGMSVEIKTKGIDTNSIVSATYSGVSVEVKAGGIQAASVGAGTYSGVSVEVKTGGIQAASVGKGAYSGVSVEVTTGGIQTVSIGKGAYSGVSVEVTTGGIQVASVGKGSYSGVTVEISNIAAGTFSGVTIDGAKFLSAAGERSAASSLLSTSLGGTTPRLLQQAFELLRNKVTVSGSTMTVFKSDDATSSWTATISTGTATVYGVAPGLA